jgi:hypothetical protein
MRVGDGNSGPLPDAGRGIGVARIKEDVGYPQLVDERPG